MADIKNVTDYLTPAELLAQLAEESAELAQAALKLRRAYDGTNPTPKTVGECLDNFKEEFGDVLLCIELFVQSVEDTPEGVGIDSATIVDQAYDIVERKEARWLERLQKAHPQKGGADGKT